MSEMVELGTFDDPLALQEERVGLAVVEAARGIRNGRVIRQKDIVDACAALTNFFTYAEVAGLENWPASAWKEHINNLQLDLSAGRRG